MGLLKRMAFVAAGLGLCLALPGQQAEVHGQQRGGGGEGRGQGRGQAPPPLLAWAPVPAMPAAWVAPNKPIWRLSDLRAKHKGEQNWTEAVVNDNIFHADYISLAPGAKTPRRFHPENRAFWVVQEGQIRFTIEGQEPFIASKGFLVQVPRRTIYSMETVGNIPSLRVEVTFANAHTMYPIDETPTPEHGVKFIQVRDDPQKGTYDDANVPFIDYNQTIAGHPVPKRNQNQFVGDDHGIANIIRGNPATQPPMSAVNKGHFHLTGPEWWFIPEGQMQYTMEPVGGKPMAAFVADQGDIVYAPASVWHNIRFAGTGMATRIAFVGYANSHVYQTPGELKGESGQDQGQ
jgi:mannose-6-phosphate isomerase-like protein (cupin superfamily)